MLYNILDTDSLTHVTPHFRVCSDRAHFYKWEDWGSEKENYVFILYDLEIHWLVYITLEIHILKKIWWHFSSHIVDNMGLIPDRSSIFKLSLRTKLASHTSKGADTHS